MVGNFQDLDGRHEPVTGHPLLCEDLRIAGEHGIERATPQIQDDAGIVRRRLGADVTARPCHHDLGVTDPPSVSLRDGPHVEPPPERVARERRAPAPRRDGDPSHVDNTRESRRAPGMIVVRVREHEDVDSSQAMTSERAPQRRGIRPCVDQHGPA